MKKHLEKNNIKRLKNENVKPLSLPKFYDNEFYERVATTCMLFPRDLFHICIDSISTLSTLMLPVLLYLLVNEFIMTDTLYRNYRINYSTFQIAPTQNNIGQIVLYIQASCYIHIFSRQVLMHCYMFSVIYSLLPTMPHFRSFLNIQNTKTC